MHDEEKQELTVANLRAPDHQRAARAQSCIGFQQGLPILKQLKMNSVSVTSRAPGINMKRKMFARGQPVCLASSKRFARLAYNLKLIVTKRALQRPMESMHRPRGTSHRQVQWRGAIRRDHESAPDSFARCYGQGHKALRHEDRDEKEGSMAH